jgi:hypothetical protein
MAGKPNKTGRDDKQHYFSLERRFIESPAWKALLPSARVVYLCIRFEWHGPQNNNNGKIRLSSRQAAEKAGLAVNAAARAFQHLQAKGFLFVTEMGLLGFSGEARGPSYEITELAMPSAERNGGRRLYAEWREGNDFPVVIHNANNPTGKNGNKTPTPKQGHACVQKGDVPEKPVPKLVTPYPQKGDVQATSKAPGVTKLETSLITIPPSPATPSRTPTTAAWLSPPGQRRTLRLPPTYQMIS